MVEKRARHDTELEMLGPFSRNDGKRARPLGVTRLCADTSNDTEDCYVEFEFRRLVCHAPLHRRRRRRRPAPNDALPQAREHLCVCASGAVGRVGGTARRRAHVAVHLPPCAPPHCGPSTDAAADRAALLHAAGHRPPRTPGLCCLTRPLGPGPLIPCRTAPGRTTAAPPGGPDSPARAEPCSAPLSVSALVLSVCLGLSCAVSLSLSLYTYPSRPVLFLCLYISPSCSVHRAYSPPIPAQAPVAGGRGLFAEQRGSPDWGESPAWSRSSSLRGALAVYKAQIAQHTCMRVETKSVSSSPASSRRDGDLRRQSLAAISGSNLLPQPQAAASCFNLSRQSLASGGNLRRALA
jgi:hypothetical protein